VSDAKQQVLPLWKTKKHRKIMKTKYSRACILSILTGGLSLFVSGCAVEFQPPVVAVGPPAVEVGPPVVEVEPAVVEVPDSYVWDGFEFVCFFGVAFFYLGPGDVWLGCDSVRLERFHHWEGFHPDWRDHAIHNDRFRRDAHGHVAPMHNEHNPHGEPGHGEPHHDHPHKPAPKDKKDERH